MSLQESFNQPQTNVDLVNTKPSLSKKRSLLSLSSSSQLVFLSSFCFLVDFLFVFLGNREESRNDNARKLCWQRTRANATSFSVSTTRPRRRQMERRKGRRRVDGRPAIGARRSTTCTTKAYHSTPTGI